MAVRPMLGGAAAGALATAVWSLQEPLDKRVFGVDYSDTELLGRAVSPNGAAWWPAGFAMHVLNGVAFGSAYAPAARRIPGPGAVKGAAAATAEHLATWPLTRLVPRHHPAARRIPKLYGNHLAFAQALWRHLLFGAIMGAAEARLNRGYPEHTPA